MTKARRIATIAAALATLGYFALVAGVVWQSPSRDWVEGMLIGGGLWGLVAAFLTCTVAFSET